MNLELEKPIAFFDLETTGIQISKDRIIEIAILKILPGGEQKRKRWMINPTIPISQEAKDIHGISDDQVKDKPKFKDVADDILNFLEGCDLAGYNSNRFDIPLLVEEFLRVNINFNMESRKSIDIQNIFHKMEQRTLIAAYKFYCNKDLINAHSAEADTEATYNILLSQIEKYNELENNISFLSKFSQIGDGFVDIAGFIQYNKDGEKIISFGKYKNITLNQIWKENPGYFSWIINADFPIYTKNIIKDFINKMRLKDKFN